MPASGPGKAAMADDAALLEGGAARAGGPGQCGPGWPRPLRRRARPRRPAHGGGAARGVGSAVCEAEDGGALLLLPGRTHRLRRGKLGHLPATLPEAPTGLPRFRHVPLWARPGRRHQFQRPVRGGAAVKRAMWRGAEEYRGGLCSTAMAAEPGQQFGKRRIAELA